VSFSEGCVRFGDQLAKRVDAGVSVRDAAERVGISRQRGYAILRATGRPVGSPQPDRRGVDVGRIVAVFTATGSINQATRAAGVSHATARRVLVERGPYGKAAARARFLELIEAGWSAARAAREVGVHVRTARDWRDGIRKIGNTRVRPDGTVIEYGGAGRSTVGQLLRCSASRDRHGRRRLHRTHQVRCYPRDRLLGVGRCLVGGPPPAGGGPCPSQPLLIHHHIGRALVSCCSNHRCTAWRE
jgi:hypothetical protein